MHKPLGGSCSNVPRCQVSCGADCVTQFIPLILTCLRVVTVIFITTSSVCSMLVENANRCTTFFVDSPSALVLSFIALASFLRLCLAGWCGCSIRGLSLDRRRGLAGLFLDLDQEFAHAIQFLAQGIGLPIW